MAAGTCFLIGLVTSPNQFQSLKLFNCGLLPSVCGLPDRFANEFRSRDIKVFYEIADSAGFTRSQGLLNGFCLWFGFSAISK